MAKVTGLSGNDEFPGRVLLESQAIDFVVHDAREMAIDRLKSEADQLGAEDVVGVKTYIAEIGHGLVEFMAIGTAVKKTAGVGVATPTLPVQAIVPDKDTWIDGDVGFQLDRAN